MNGRLPIEPEPIDPRPDAATVFAANESAGDPVSPDDPTTFSPTTDEPTLVPSANEARPVRVGDVLNHLYAVRRSIGHGGMGEVFEGVNITNEAERVAIKVILPHLSKDPKVLALFRKEARILTPLSHPVLVHYRTLAQEPQLGVLYIVTEFIDGRSLSDVLGTIQPTTPEVCALLRRLAEGMAHAHQLGAVHRDLSPDNVMLEDGRLDRPRIIDFGIAKDIDRNDPTILGDSFAGKLGYVAPEQLGAYERKVGPWSDVYSLGLTILALLRGRDVDMGATIYEAVENRRTVPDLSAAPAQLRPLLGAMLLPDPAQRLRTMDDVLAGLGGIEAVFFGHTAVKPEEAARPARPATRRAWRMPAWATDPVLRRPLLIGGAAILAMLAAAGAGQLLLGGSGRNAPTPPPSGGIEAVQRTVATADAALKAGMRQIGCSWLDADDIRARDSEIGLRLSGVAGDPLKAQIEIGKILAARGLRAASINASRTETIGRGACAPLDAFRQIRAGEGGHIRLSQTTWEMLVLPEGRSGAGTVAAPVAVELNLNGIAGDVALVGIEESGATSVIGLTRKMLDDPKLGMKTGEPNVYVPEIQTSTKGLAGIALLHGAGPFDPDLLNTDPATRDGDWVSRFAARAKAQGWLAEMVWYRAVDEVPN